MIKLNLSLLYLLMLSGCATNYPEIKNIDHSSFLRFERHVVDPILGSTTGFYKFSNSAGAGCDNFEETQVLAVLDDGNPLIPNTNPDGLRVRSDEYLRIRIGNFAGNLATCDTIIGFIPDKGQEYKITVFAELLWQYNTQCSAELSQLQLQSNTYKKIKPKEYKNCNSRK